MVFLSSDPARSDHEIALMRGRPEHDDPHLINQISMRVETLDDLRDFHRRIKAKGYQIHRVVSHASAIGCYFADPEGNTTEVFWLTGRPSWVPVGEPIDVEQPDAVVMAQVDRLWKRLRHVPVGGTLEAGVPAG
jgi:catechol 2,3-dioxygenase